MVATPIFMLVMLCGIDWSVFVAMLIFIAAALTDMFDGKIARKQGLITDFGKFLDPLADKMLTTAAFLVFLALGVTDVWAVMLVLTREFMVTSVRLMAAKDGTVVAASFSGKLKTVAQYIAIIAMMTALAWQDFCAAYLPTVPTLVYTLPILISQIFIWISVALTCISGVQYFWQFRHYFNEN